MAADSTPIIVTLSDNAKLQWNGSFVKMKALVRQFNPIINTSKDFYIAVDIQFYENLSGSYGSKITDLISADGTLTSDQKTSLLSIYGDKFFEHFTVNNFCDASGNIVAPGTAGATTEIAYWQQFLLNQVAGITAITTQGAFDAIYKIVQALVAKMNTRKNW